MGAQNNGMNEGAISRLMSLQWRFTTARLVRVVGALLAAGLLAGTARAATFPDKPPTADFFVDQAQLISEKDRKAANDIAGKLLQEQRIPLLVVTVSSLAAQEAANYSIENYAQALFNEWGIGTPDRNYGMLLLVSRGDRKARIELGAGWAGQHDAEAISVMSDLIVPAFKQGDYSRGILDGVRGMDSMARGLALPQPTPPWWFLPALIGGAVLLVAAIVNLFRTGHKGWAWALIAVVGFLLFFFLRAASESRGSGGGFGGGSSGGGGATGSW